MQGFIALREIIKKLNSKFNKLFLTQISRKSLNMNYHKLNMNYFERFWNRFLKNFSRSDSLLFGQTRGSAPTRAAGKTNICG